MTIKKPTYQEIINRSRADITNDIPELDPTIFASLIRGIDDSLASRSFDIVLLFEQLEKQLFPQTSTGEFLDLWAAYEGLTRLAATGSEGPVTLTGTTGKTLNTGDELTSQAGNAYLLKAGITFALQTVGISSLTRSGTFVTAVTTSPHQLATNIDVIIAGADQSEYNGSFVITVISETEFAYEIEGTPATPATGTIQASFEGAFGEVESEVENDSENGIEVNLESGAKLTLSSPEIGIDPTVRVQFLGVTGGADVESNESLLNRILQSRQNPVANFNPTSIIKEVLKVAGVTRVKVKRITPHVGAVTVLFVRDNDDNIIPDAGEVQDVRDVLLIILPAQTAEDDLIVTAPAPVTTDYNLASISPDTPTMRTALKDNLVAFYKDSVDFETDITQDKYRSAIIDTVDPDTGQELDSFVLSAPAGTITVSTDEIGILGNVTF